MSGENKFAGIPAELRSYRQWAVWRKPGPEGDVNKAPYQPSGRYARSNDPETWTTFDRAAEAVAAPESPWGGVSFMFDHDDPFVGIDFDGCLDNGEVAEWAKPWLDQLAAAGAYAEISISGEGVKVWIRGKLRGPGGKRSIGDAKHTGIEVYDRGRPFIATGDIFGEPVSSIGEDQGLVDQLYNFVKAPQTKAKAATPAKVRTAVVPDAKPPREWANLPAEARGRRLRRAAAYLAAVDPAVSGEGGHGATLRAAIKTGPGFDLPIYRAFELLRDEFNPRCDPPWHEDELLRKVTEAYNVEPNRGWLVADEDEEARWANTAPDDPSRISHRHLQSYDHNGDPTLAFHRGEWLEWRGAAWKSRHEQEIAARVHRTATEHFRELNAHVDPEKPKYRKVTTGIVANVLQALKADVLVDGDVEAPAWLDGRSDWKSADILPMARQLVHLPSLASGRDDEAVIPATPRFFGRYALDYDYVPNAPTPHAWLTFLDSVWPDDSESVELLQEWFGYLLTADTSQQKILMLVGPPRAGKGVICRTLTALVGEANRGAPTLSGLVTTFGLEPLIDKPLAIIGDARLSGKQDQSQIVERLLSISGEDAITVDRKNKVAWTGRLPSRFVITSNELPRLQDSSGALVSRLLILQFRNSFEGQEDLGLEAKLAAELSGILLWAVEGWKRLRARGRFKQPAAARELVEQMGDLASPISQFVRETCTTGEGLRVPMADLYAAWREWCEANGRTHPGTANSFGRDLLAAFPKIARTNVVAHKGRKCKCYDGVALLDDAAAPPLSVVGF